MDQARGNCLSKPMVNLVAIIFISLTYRLSFEAYIQEVENFARKFSYSISNHANILLHYYSAYSHCYMGNLFWKMFSWRIKDHSCCPPQAKIKSKSYLNTSSNSMALFQATYCCIFTSHNLPNCYKGLKSYCINKSLTPLGSKMSTPQSLLLLIITQQMVKSARSQWPTTWQEYTYR